MPGNKELVKWRGVSFRESQHGIVLVLWFAWDALAIAALATKAGN